MDDCVTIVVIGATGHFGARISRRLTNEPNTQLIVTSRDERSAQALAKSLSANVKGARLDQTSSSFADDLERLAPTIVIHTAGPYQGQNYCVAEACIACKSHYIDLADGRDFVNGFSQLDESAKRAGVVLVAGASTLPALSSAVVFSLLKEFSRLNSINISIAPAHQTPRGIGTIAAVLSYCGRPFRVLENGRWVKRYGWQDMRIQRYPSLGKRLSGVCDVPDLILFPDFFKDVETVTFHAALEAWWEQIGLWLMAGLTRLRVVPGWRKCVPLFHAISGRLIGLGSDTGGMHIRLTGVDKDGDPKTCAWFLSAGQNHGPEIPCSPALVLARKFARGETPEAGARACIGLMSLSDFDEEVSDLDISWELSG